MGKLYNFDKYKFTKMSKRIGNLCIRNYYLNDYDVPMSLATKNDVKFSHFQIVKYHPNIYYHTKNLYQLTPYGNYQKDGGAIIDASFFERPETCFTLAYWIDINHDELTPDLKFVGSRPFELNANEMRDFLYLAKHGQKQIEKMLKKQSEKYRV